MSWRKPRGNYDVVSPRGLQAGDTVIAPIGGGFDGEWRLRYYLVEPAPETTGDAV